MLTRNLLFLTFLCAAACTERPLDGDDDFTETAGETSAMQVTEESGSTRDTPEAWTDGELWGACPTDPTTGLPHLCNEGIACSPTTMGNMCLPVGECPESPGFGTELSLGWGNVCYPRCGKDADCAPGMICDTTINAEPMCAWPIG